jgi:hypothetical protein
MSRRVLYHPDRVQLLLREMHERHVAELAALRAELDGIRELYDQLRSVTLARSKAEVEVAALRRLQAIGRARAAERDPATPLQ